MMKRALSAVSLIGVLAAAGCASTPSDAPDPVVRSLPPRQFESSITNYFDATAKSVDPNRELVIGEPQRGTCPMSVSGGPGGYVGWVVPVEHKTRSKDSKTVTVSMSYFWFSDEVIRGVTRRMEICP